MKALHGRPLFILLAIALAACDAGAPTEPSAVTRPTAVMQPSPAPPALPPAQAFSITGVVTGDGGAPMPGAVVTMAHWEAGRVNFPSVATDATGAYAITFSANPLGSGFVARAQVVAAGYEEYWRSLMAVPSGTTVVQNFRLYRIVSMTAGDSMPLSVPPDIGDCRGWVAEVCAIVRVVAPRDGNLRIEVLPSSGSAAPPVEVCCVNGDEQGGNPMTVPVAAEFGLELRIGMPRGLTTTQSFLVKTSYEGS